MCTCLPSESHYLFDSCLCGRLSPIRCFPQWHLLLVVRIQGGRFLHSDEDVSKRRGTSCNHSWSRHRGGNQDTVWVSRPYTYFWARKTFSQLHVNMIESYLICRVLCSCWGMKTYTDIIQQFIEKMTYNFSHIVPATINCACVTYWPNYIITSSSSVIQGAPCTCRRNIM